MAKPELEPKSSWLQTTAPPHLWGESYCLTEATEDPARVFWQHQGLTKPFLFLAEAGAAAVSGEASQVLSLQRDMSPQKPPATWPRRPTVLGMINLPPSLSLAATLLPPPWRPLSLPLPVSAQLPASWGRHSSKTTQARKGSPPSWKRSEAGFTSQRESRG